MEPQISASPPSRSDSPSAAALTAAARPLLARGPAWTRSGGLLAGFEPTTLAGLDAVLLLDRLDTKFLLAEAQLGAIVPALADDYDVLEIADRHLHQYRTLYFDTPGFDLYRRHHAGRAVRQKVRSRLYVESGLAFFEVKERDRLGRTIKHRLATESLLTRLSPGAHRLLARHVEHADRMLEPKVRNDFSRITLVGKRSPERVTLDVGIQFDYDGRTAILPGVAIAEVKQSGVDLDSPFMRRMREAELEPTSVSKYCVGVALLVEGVEHDAFDEKLRAFERLTRAE